MLGQKETIGLKRDLIKRHCFLPTRSLAAGILPAVSKGRPMFGCAIQGQPGMIWTEMLTNQVIYIRLESEYDGGRGVSGPRD